MRAKPLLSLLYSIKKQELYPNEIIIIDGSLNNETKEILELNKFENLKYFLVNESDRGLTRQRNYGITKINKTSDIVCFLDDDTVLEPDYFLNLLSTYQVYPDCLGVCGFITNETQWEKVSKDYKPQNSEYVFDGWKRKEPSRFIIRKKLRLDCNLPPGYIPKFSHGRSVGFLPPSGKTYKVQQFMGGVASYKQEIFDLQKFSNYFEGYGLYEDADFTSRLGKKGSLYVNTSARLAHYHDDSGRPNKYNYGKMVVRNGWYVWRIYIAKPGIKNRLKWNAITLILIGIRFSNIFTSNNKKEALTETMGRVSGYLSLFYNRPTVNNLGN